MSEQHLILLGWVDITGVCEDAGWHSASAVDMLVELGIDKRDAEAYVDYAFRELFAKFAEGAGASTWPLTEDDVPGSLEEAEDAAREHGREQAEKFEHAMKCARHSKARR